MSTAPIESSGWLTQAEWEWVQARVPILCVDLVPIRTVKEGPLVGLIRRDTPHQGIRWCLIGGRVLHNEPLRAGSRRHLIETLGDSIRIVLPHPFEPLLTTEYFSVRHKNELYDPRQHALALVFLVNVGGKIQACGEAHEFRWFRVSSLPAPRAFGFGQQRVLQSALERLKLAPKAPSNRGVKLTRITRGSSGEM